ncbi:hypothetical protein [Streptomyces sp. NPDC054797]
MTNALTRLLEIAPAPSETCQKDWGEVERSLGVELPAHYKELIHVYGGSNWDDYLYVLEPGCPNENYDLVEWAQNQAEDLEDLWEFEKKQTELEVEGSRVIPWATTDNGECARAAQADGSPDLARLLESGAARMRSAVATAASAMPVWNGSSNSSSLPRTWIGHAVRRSDSVAYQDRYTPAPAPAWGRHINRVVMRRFLRVGAWSRAWLSAGESRRRALPGGRLGSLSRTVGPPAIAVPLHLVGHRGGNDHGTVLGKNASAFRRTAHLIVSDAAALAQELSDLGYRVLTGVRRLVGHEVEAFRHPELRDLLLPVIRADMAHRQGADGPGFVSREEGSTSGAGSTTTRSPIWPSPPIAEPARGRRWFLGSP